jgi:hypothetical protein
MGNHHGIAIEFAKRISERVELSWVLIYINECGFKKVLKWVRYSCKSFSSFEQIFGHPLLFDVRKPQTFPPNWICHPVYELTQWLRLCWIYL